MTAHIPGGAAYAPIVGSDNVPTWTLVDGAGFVRTGQTDPRQFVTRGDSWRGDTLRERAARLLSLARKAGAG